MTKYKINLSVEEKEFLNAEIIGKEAEEMINFADKKSHIHYKMETYLSIEVMDEPSINKKFGSIVQFAENVAGVAIGNFLRRNGVMVTDLCKDRLTIQEKLLEITRREFEKYHVEIERFFISSVEIMDKNIIRDATIKEMNSHSSIEIENS